MLAWSQACSRPRRLILISAGVLSFPWVGSVASADLLPLASVDDLRGLSREPLANVQVTSVSKTAEPLSDAVAAVYVISHDDIVRSGAASAPEVMRLAPNRQVSAITASSYAITARVLNVNAAYKLLLLVDCRSVYTPLFGGVLWGEIAVRLEDIGRIEVIGGPCAMVWGANAGNGVINIVTPKSNDTPGGLLELDAGTRATTATLEYGGKLATDLRYRVYADGPRMAGDKTSTGALACDAWSRRQGGFRPDWTPSTDHVSLQGDILGADERQLGTPAARFAGANLQIN